MMTQGWARHLVIGLLAVLLAGCDGVQSTLAPITEEGDSVARLSLIIFVGAGIILAAVVVFTAYAAFASPDRRRWMSDRRFVVAGGIVFPVVTLSVLLVYGLLLTGAARPAKGNAPLSIEVTGEQFWWRVAYAGDGQEPAFHTANEIHIPVGRPVELTLKSADVIHSFWVPKLTGKTDMIPGQENTMVVEARETGSARGQCTEYCGVQHAQMAFHLVASEPGAYQEWRKRESGPAVEPTTDLTRRGRDLFLSAGCGACHMIRGTAADGVIGPDLTHFGSRQSVGSGVLTNNVENIALWISASEHLKPGNKMPPFEAIERNEREAIAAYLESLK